jgi:hypothetical protein
LTLVVLDTNAYLRLAKRVRPMLGVEFGQNKYKLIVLKQVEDEVHQSAKLKLQFPWFDEQSLASERLANRIRLSADETNGIQVAQSVFRQQAISQVARFSKNGRSPPSMVDCYILAFAQLKQAKVVTDDLGMHELAADFELKPSLWHGHELLHKMLSAKVVGRDLVIEIFDALERNRDLPATWQLAKNVRFKKLFKTNLS